jgi:biotin operon repressor
MKQKVIDIKDYLSTEKYTTRKELVEATGFSDREVRSRISELKKKRVVIYSSQNTGYRLAKELKSLTKEEREKEVELVKHSLNDCKSRTTQLNKQKRKYIAYIKKAEQIALEEENMNHIPRID